MSDDLERLIRAAQAGDGEAYGRLVGRYRAWALAAAYGRLCDFQLAQDAVQETFLAVWRDLAVLREPLAFSGWLRKILFKQCDRVARRRCLPTVPLESVVAMPATEGDPQRAALRRSLQAEVRTALHALSEPQRQTVLLYYVQGYSTREVARALEIPVSSVKKRLYDARRKLGERMLRLSEEAPVERDGGREEHPDRADAPRDAWGVDPDDATWAAQEVVAWRTTCRLWGNAPFNDRWSFWPRGTGASLALPGRFSRAPAEPGLTP